MVKVAKLKPVSPCLLFVSFCFYTLKLLSLAKKEVAFNKKLWSANS